MRRTLVLLRALVEYARTSIFLVPLGFIAGATGLSWLTTALDRRIGERGEVPPLLVSTVESARALLSTVAGATLTFAAISISISLLLTQMATSQFSPRVAYSYFRDPATRWVLGVVVGTFTYCLLILRVARAAVTDGGSPSIPRLSVLVATVLGVASVLAIVWLVNHTARTMRVEEIIHRIAETARAQVAERCAPMGKRSAPSMTEPNGPRLDVSADRTGWVQQMHVDGVLEAAPDGGSVSLQVHPGGFVAGGTLLARVWPEPREPEEAADRIRGAIRVGAAPTMQQDIGFGIRQLADVALRALSPGVHDPTTAVECVAYLGSVMHELVPRDTPPRVIGGEGDRRLLVPSQPDFDAYVELAFGQIRRASTDRAVMIALLDVLGTLTAAATRVSLDQRAEALRREARLLLEALPHAGLVAADADRVREVAARRGFA